MVKEQLIYFEPDGQNSAANKSKDPFVKAINSRAKQLRRQGDAEIADAFERGANDLAELMDDVRELSKERYDKQKKGEL
jgi:hypothetical protein